MSFKMFGKVPVDASYTNITVQNVINSTQMFTCVDNANESNIAESPQSQPSANSDSQPPPSSS